MSEKEINKELAKAKALLNAARASGGRKLSADSKKKLGKVGKKVSKLQKSRKR